MVHKQYIDRYGEDLLGIQGVGRDELVSVSRSVPTFSTPPARAATARASTKAR